MIKIIDREKALKLRRSGKSIGRIANMLKVSKGTVSYWCRDIKLTDKQIKNLTTGQKKSGNVGFTKICGKTKEKKD